MKKSSSRPASLAGAPCSVPLVLLPEYEQAEAHWFSGESDALAALVYNWSPTGPDETAWREKVHAALDHAYSEGRLSALREQTLDGVPAEMRGLTFRVEHSPNCLKQFMVRLVSHGQGALDGLPHDKTKDSCGYGHTLRAAAEHALSVRSAPNGPRDPRGDNLTS